MALVVIGSTAFLASTAFGASSTEVLTEITRAAQLEGSAPASETMSLQKRGDQIATKTDFGEVNLAVPAGKVTNTALGAIVEGEGDSNIVFQKVGEGSYRASIHIASPSDPERYEFTVIGATRLIQDHFSGSVFAFDDNGQTVAKIEAPWAKDANGKDVPTRYEVDGMTLTQIVAHHSGLFAYGVTADPWVAAALLAARLAAQAAARRAAERAAQAAAIFAANVAKCKASVTCKAIIAAEGLHQGAEWAKNHL